MKRGASRHQNMGSPLRRAASQRQVARLAMKRSALITAEALERRVFLSSAPIISEFVALNNNGLADENGDRGDWLELYNPGTADVNLDGYYLTDDASTLNKWRLPAVTLRSGSFLTVFADEKNRAVAGSVLHT